MGDKLSPLSFSGQSSLCRQALLFQGRCTVIWCLDLLLAEDEGPKPDLSQKLCCFGQEGGRLSGSRRWRCLRSSLALACPRNGWPLYSTPSPVQPALHRVPEPGSRLGLRHKPLGLADPCALTRKVASCLYLSFLRPGPGACLGASWDRNSRRKLLGLIKGDSWLHDSTSL